MWRWENHQTTLEKAQKNRPVLLGRILHEISRKCFLVSTTEDLDSSQEKITGTGLRKKNLAGGFIDCHRYKGTKKASYWMPFWYRTMCEELFCVSILIYQDEDCNNKNNLLKIVFTISEWVVPDIENQSRCNA